MRKKQFTTALFGIALIALIGIILAGNPSGEQVAADDAASKYWNPVKSMGVYLDAFHFHNGDIKKQCEIHHYCSQVNEDLIQCALFDGNGAGARLVGVEYVISEKAFTSLPEEEKNMWHSHVYEVKSGQLVSPGLSEEAELDLMRKVMSTYGKTWHTWPTEHFDDKLPLGAPSLMMAFTRDGQAQQELIEKRDRSFNISTGAKKKARAGMEAPPVQPGADAWQTGRAFQAKLTPVSP
jgi:hypothetical protein